MNQTPDIREPVNSADNQVYTEQNQQRNKPPGIVHVRHVEHLKKLGCAGVVSQGVNEKFDFRNLTVCAAELDFEMLFGLESPAVKVKPIPKFPAIARDLSLVVDETVCWADIMVEV